MNMKLDIAFWDYDRTRALAEGGVKMDGVDGTFHTAPIVTEIFRGMIADHCFDISELGFTYFLLPLRTAHPPSSRSLFSPTAPSGIPPFSSTKRAESRSRKI